VTCGTLLPFARSFVNAPLTTVPPSRSRPFAFTENCGVARTREPEVEADGRHGGGVVVEVRAEELRGAALHVLERESARDRQRVAGGGDRLASPGPTPQQEAPRRPAASRSALELPSRTPRHDRMSFPRGDGRLEGARPLDSTSTAHGRRHSMECSARAVVFMAPATGVAGEVQRYR
jgi:hypothetical protein